MEIDARLPRRPPQALQLGGQGRLQEPAGVGLAGVALEAAGQDDLDLSCEAVAGRRRRRDRVGRRSRPGRPPAETLPAIPSRPGGSGRHARMSGAC